MEYSVQSVMREYGIRNPCFMTLKELKCCYKLLLNRASGSVNNRKKILTGVKIVGIDKAVCAWYKQQQTVGVPGRRVRFQAVKEWFSDCVSQSI